MNIREILTKMKKNKSEMIKNWRIFRVKNFQRDVGEILDRERIVGNESCEVKEDIYRGG